MIPSPPRVTFDSNAWERVFDPYDGRYAPVQAALSGGRIKGFICEAGFRIEAITKRQRPDYFAQPLMDVTTDIKPLGNGTFELITSIGPDDRKHPGVSDIQATKLRLAMQSGMKIMWGQYWLGLPRPPGLYSPANFVVETAEESEARQERQRAAASQIEGRGVGRGAFAAVGGWEGRPRTQVEDKQLAKACAEWADGELVAAHIAYQNDVLCTDDRARGAGVSVFDAQNRAWLAADFGVVFMTLDGLMAMVAS
jgi:hypothetical protein